MGWPGPGLSRPRALACIWSQNPTMKDNRRPEALGLGPLPGSTPKQIYSGQSPYHDISPTHTNRKNKNTLFCTVINTLHREYMSYEEKNVPTMQKLRIKNKQSVLLPMAEPAPSRQPSSQQLIGHKGWPTHISSEEENTCEQGMLRPPAPFNPSLIRIKVQLMSRAMGATVDPPLS